MCYVLICFWNELLSSMNWKSFPAWSIRTLCSSYRPNLSRVSLNGARDVGISYRRTRQWYTDPLPTLPIKQPMRCSSSTGIIKVADVQEILVTVNQVCRSYISVFPTQYMLVLWNFTFETCAYEEMNLCGKPLWIQKQPQLLFKCGFLFNKTTIRDKLQSSL